MRDVALSVASDTTVRGAANDARTLHFVLPPDPNVKMADESLAGVAGGVRAGALNSIGTAGAFVCSNSPSTLGNAGSASTRRARLVHCV